MRPGKLLLMYARQTLNLYALWLVRLCIDVTLRLLMVMCIPIILIWSNFGMAWSQQSAQASFSLSGFLLRGWPKPPPTDWHLFLGLRRRKATKHRIITGEVLPPLE